MRIHFISADVQSHRKVDGRNHAAERQEAAQADEIRVTLTPRLDRMAAQIQGHSQRTGPAAPSICN